MSAVRSSLRQCSEMVRWGVQVRPYLYWMIYSVANQTPRTRKEITLCRRGKLTTLQFNSPWRPREGARKGVSVVRVTTQL